MVTQGPLGSVHDAAQRAADILAVLLDSAIGADLHGPCAIEEDRISILTLDFVTVLGDELSL